MKNPEHRQGELKTVTQELLANNPELEAIFRAHQPSGEIELSESGKIVSSGQEYTDIPKMRELVRLANSIRESLSPVEVGSKRLWRGNRPEEVGLNPSYTNSLEGIALPFLRSYNGVLSYVDVPEDELETYLQRGAVAADAEFLLPPELVKDAKIVGFSREEIEEIKSKSKPQSKKEDEHSGWGVV